MSIPTVSKDFTNAVFDYLAKLGIDEQQILAELELSSRSQMLIDDRVPLKHYEKLYDIAQQLTGDCYIGLHVGASPFPQTWGLVSYLAMTAPNFLLAIKALMHYSRLQLDFGRFELIEVDEEFVSIAWRSDTAIQPSSHVVEHLYANILQLAESQLRYPRSPRTICFRHAAAGDPRHVEEVLSAKVLFSQPEYTTLVRKENLSTESGLANEPLHQAALGLANEQLMELLIDDKLINNLNTTIIERLPHGLPRLEDVAEAMNITPRTMQRRLQERNLTYQLLLDHVRNGLALDLIRNPDLSIHDIAQLLGFHDQSAFQRAFKRWEGVTPGIYRQNL